MKVSDLIDNREFSFNVDFRIVKYSPTPYDPDYLNVLYSSLQDDDLEYGLMDLNISAINQNDNVIDIEVY
jgi:hypothetical protein